MKMMPSEGGPSIGGAAPAPVLTLDTSKAGMGSVRKADVERIINEVSAGTPFYVNEERKRRQRAERTTEMVAKIAPLRPLLEERGRRTPSEDVAALGRDDAIGGGLRNSTFFVKKEAGASVQVKAEPGSSGPLANFLVKRERFDDAHGAMMMGSEGNAVPSRGTKDGGRPTVRSTTAKAPLLLHTCGGPGAAGNRKGTSAKTAAAPTASNCKSSFFTRPGGDATAVADTSADAAMETVQPPPHCRACVESIVSSCDAAEEALVRGLVGSSVVTLKGGWRALSEVRAVLRGAAEQSCNEAEKSEAGATISAAVATSKYNDDPFAYIGEVPDTTAEPQKRRTLQQQQQHEQQQQQERQQQVFLPTFRVLLPNFFGVFAHLDMDAFFAAVEEKDDPSLRAIPFAVGGMSMLSTSNYMARQFGVRAAMPGYIATRLCPQLHIVKPNFNRYVTESSHVKEVVAQYDPRFRSGGLDEVGLDLLPFLLRRRQAEMGLAHWEATEQASKLPATRKVEKEEEEVIQTVGVSVKAERADMPLSLPPPPIMTIDVIAELPSLLDEASAVIAELRQRIFERTGLTASAGIAATKTLAKIMSNRNKPNGQYTEGFLRSTSFNAHADAANDPPPPALAGHCSVIGRDAPYPPNVAESLVYRRHARWLGLGTHHWDVAPCTHAGGAEFIAAPSVKEEEAEGAVRLHQTINGDDGDWASGNNRSTFLSAALLAHLSTNVAGNMRPREVPSVGKAGEEVFNALGIARCADLYAARYVLRHALTPKTFEHTLSIALGAMGSWGGASGAAPPTSASSTVEEKGRKRPREDGGDGDEGFFNPTIADDADGSGGGGIISLAQPRERDYADVFGDGGGAAEEPSSLLLQKQQQQSDDYFNPFGRHKDITGGGGPFGNSSSFSGNTDAGGSSAPIDRKSMSNDRTFPQCADPSAFVDVALRVTNIVANRLLEEGLTYKHVTLKLKGTDFIVKQYSMAMPSYAVRSVGERPERPKRAHRREPCPMALPTPCASAADPANINEDVAAYKKKSLLKGDGEEDDGGFGDAVDDNADSNTLGGQGEDSKGAEVSGSDADDEDDDEAGASFGDDDDVNSSGHEFYGIRRSLWVAVSGLLGPHLASFASFRLLGVRCGALAAASDAVALNQKEAAAAAKGPSVAPPLGGIKALLAQAKPQTTAAASAASAPLAAKVSQTPPRAARLLNINETPSSLPINSKATTNVSVVGGGGRASLLTRLLATTPAAAASSVHATKSSFSLPTHGVKAPFAHQNRRAAANPRSEEVLHLQRVAGVGGNSRQPVAAQQEDSSDGVVVLDSDDDDDNEKVGVTPADAEAHKGLVVEKGPSVAQAVASTAQGGVPNAAATLATKAAVEIVDVD